MSNWRAVWIAVGLVGITWAVFGQVASFEFVNFDDPDYTTSNHFVRAGLNSRNIGLALTTSFASNWIPLTWMSLMLDTELYGNWAGGFHLTNVVLHTANVLLLYLVLCQMTGALYRSAFVSALFAIHPLHVESVAWVAERKDVLSTFFGLIAIGAYVRYAQSSPPLAEGGPRGSRWWWYTSALIAFAASLMSKQMLVTLPFVLLLLDYWPLERKAGWTRLVLEKTPFFLLTVGASVAAMIAQRQGGSVIQWQHYTWWQRLTNAVVAYVLYLKRTFWPADLSFFYPQLKNGVSAAAVLMALFALGALSLWAVSQRRNRPYLLVGWLWFLGTLVPVVGVIQVGGQQSADRYTYFPLIGVFLAVTWTCASWGTSRPWVNTLWPKVAVVVVLASIAIAFRQTATWRDNTSLYTHALRVDNSNYLAYNNLGVVSYQQGNFQQAIEQFEAALCIWPEYLDAQINLGRSHYQLALSLDSRSRYEEAVHEYEQALAFDPNNADIHGNLGLALCDLNRLDEALIHHRKAVVLSPENPAAHFNLAVTLSRLQHTDDAVAELHEAIRLAPNFMKARNNLGVMLDAAGKPADAIAQYKAILRLDENDVTARYNLARALSHLQKFEAADREFAKVVALKPDFAQARYEWAQTLLKTGKNAEAITQFEEALRLNPTFAEARRGLNAARGGKGEVSTP